MAEKRHASSDGEFPSMVFEDHNRRRWRWICLLAGAGAAAAIILLVELISGLLWAPELPALAISADTPSEPKFTAAIGGDYPPNHSLSGKSRPISPLDQRPLLRTAFMSQDEPNSFKSLRRNIAAIDIVFPDCYRCTTPDGAIDGSLKPELAEYFSSQSVLLFPRLANVDTSDHWNGKALSRLWKDPQASSRLIDELVTALQRDRAAGVNIDFEELEDGSLGDFARWFDDLGRALHSRGLYLSVDVPLSSQVFPYEQLARAADLVVVMAYDEHYPGGEPGPIASHAWSAAGLNALPIPREKLLAGIGAYSYDWQVGSSTPAASLSFGNTITLARRWNATISTDTASRNSFFRYRAPDGKPHEVWMLDAVSAWNDWQTVQQLRCRGMALWRLGLEDVGVWEFLGSETPDPASLARIPALPGTLWFGEGELINVVKPPQEGSRRLTMDQNGRVAEATYEQLPGSYETKRFGHSAGRKVVLTFDDGPHPVWTPKILDVLAKEGVHGVFFVVGDLAIQESQLLQRMWDEGHLIGNHTYMHPDLEAVSQSRLELELNATQRLLQSAIGHKTLLFRPPYSADVSTQTSSQLEPLYQAGRLGYVVVGGDIETRDWEQTSAEHVVQTVLRQLEETSGNIIVFHDAGGDRLQTVQAVAKLIPALRERGYVVTDLPDLIAQPRDAVMPPLTQPEQMSLVGQTAWGWLQTTGAKTIKVLFWATTAIAIARILFLGALVLKRQRRTSPLADSFAPPVQVTIAAYNEQEVIARTLTAVLKADYPQLSVLVVDDGSTDQTAEIVEQFARRDSRVELLRQPNSGKASALNRGFQRSGHEFIVTIDADTIILPQTIRHLVAPFAEKSVDAVCGNVQVGNTRNVLTRFQDVEYVTSQNYDRRAFEVLNCISVVPGATGAWRRRRVLEVGGYSRQTLTEDADVTIALLRAGGKIVYAAEARSITEAPESLRTLFRQRFRWSYGTFQCLWKHRQAMLRNTFGWVVLPNMLMFGILFPLLMPLGDIMLAWGIFRGAYSPILFAYSIYLAMELSASVVAFIIDRRRLRDLWVVPLQRFYYRPFMYVIAMCSLLAALRGSRHGWNKVRRWGNVALPAAQTADDDLCGAVPFRP